MNLDCNTLLQFGGIVLFIWLMMRGCCGGMTGAAAPKPSRSRAARTWRRLAVRQVRTCLGLGRDAAVEFDGECPARRVDYCRALAAGRGCGIRALERFARGRGDCRAAFAAWLGERALRRLGSLYRLEPNGGVKTTL